MAWKRLITILNTAARSFAVLLLLSHNCQATVAWQKYSYFQNWGGLNDNISTLEIADNEATDIQNVVFDTGGAITKRYGYNNINASKRPYSAATPSLYTFGSGAITGLAYFKKSNGNAYLVGIVNAGNQAYAFAKTLDASGAVPTGPWSRIDVGNLPTGYSNNNLVSFSVAQDTLVIDIPASSISKPFAWSGTGPVATLTADVNVTPTTISAFHKNILFIAGDSNNPSRVRFSDLTNGITTYVATDFFDLDKNNGQHVTGMISAFGNLYIFENNSIWMLTGSTRDDFALQKMVDNVGTLSAQSISIVNNAIFFVTTQNDIAVYDGNFGVKFLSSKIRQEISANNVARSSQALGIGFSTYKNKDLDYYVAESHAASTINNDVLVFDTYRSAWTNLVGMSINAWTVMPDGQNKDILVTGDYNGMVYFYPDVGSYSDVANTCSSGNICSVTSPAIYAFYQTKWFRYPDLALSTKYLRLLKTYVVNDNNASTLTIEVKSDYEISGNIYHFTFANSGALWGVAQWGVDKWAGGGLNIDREEVNIGKTMFQIRYSNNNPGESMTILGYELFVEPSDQI